MTLESKLQALVAKWTEAGDQARNKVVAWIFEGCARELEALLAERQPRERMVSREEFNNGIADEAAQSCVDWSNSERRKEALRYIVKQIWDSAINEQHALAERQEPPESDYIHIEAAARRGLFAWRDKPHNAKWWKKIDGTPIPNDLIVCVALEISRTLAAAQPSSGMERTT